MAVKYHPPSSNIRWNDLVEAARANDEERLLRLATEWRDTLRAVPGGHLRRLGEPSDYAMYARHEARLAD